MFNARAAGLTAFLFFMAMPAFADRLPTCVPPQASEAPTPTTTSSMSLQAN